MAERQGFIRKNEILYNESKQFIRIGGDTYNFLLQHREGLNDFLFLRKPNPIDYTTPEEEKKTQSFIILPDLLNPLTEPQTGIEILNQLINNDFDLFKYDYAINNILRRLTQNEEKKIILTLTLENGENIIMTLTRNFIDELTDIISNRFIEEAQEQTGSDLLDRVSQIGINNIQAEILNRRRERLFNNNGLYFRHLNLTNIDLSKYQIFNELQNLENINLELNNQHCLLHSLKQHNILEKDLMKITEEQYNFNNSSIDSIKTSFDCSIHFKKSDLKQVSRLINKVINLSYYDSKNKLRTTTYNNTDSKEIVNLALFQNHYFINETTDFSYYSSMKYNEVKEIKDFKNITEKKHKKYLYEKHNKINSLTLIRNLFNTNNFKLNHFSMKETHEGQKYNIKPSLDLINIEQELFSIKEPKIKDSRIIVYGDIETDTTTYHEPLLIRFVLETKNNKGSTYTRLKNESKQSFINRSFNGLFHMTKKYKNVVIYFHNLKYDFNTFKDSIYYTNTNIEKEGQLYKATFLINKKKFEVRDSYKFLNFPLSKFQSSLELNEDLNKKEAISYKYYTKGNIHINKVNIDLYKSFLNEKDYKTFDQNIKLKNKYNQYIFEYDSKNNTFNPIEYYKYYLYYDTEILKEGMIKFNNIINNIINDLNKEFNKNVKVNIFNFLTISALTYYIYSSYDAYKGCYKVKGNLREYINNAIRGGMVQTNKKYEKKIINKKISDFDGVSLYPSSISRFNGCPLGKAKKLLDLTKSYLDSLDYYIINIEITKINKFQQIPIVSYKNKKGIMTYTNEIKEPLITTIDKTTFEDWIKFQEIEYQILEGVYWNNGFNVRKKEINSYLFKERLKYKKMNNEALQLTLKLILNVSYGKTITKKEKFKTTLIKAEYYKDYLYNNFNTIRRIKKLNNLQYEIKQFQYDDSFSLCHIGVSILSMSKRIMNEIFNICNNNNYPIYYTDTDSIHMNYDDVKKLNEDFYNEHKKVLIGKNLCQFHNDFELHGSKKGEDIYSTKSIFLGKKAYIDCLESKNEKGHKIKGFHYRLKGVNKNGIEYETKNHKNIFELYKKLSKGKNINFCLNPQGFKPCFEYGSKGVILRKTGTFKRTVKF